MTYDCIIVGGGTAGMTAAITLGRNQKQVLLIEQCKELGKKLLATGNGRCNFTNSYYDSNTYRGDALFAKAVYEQFPYYKTIEFMHSIGVLQQEREGYFYPYTNQAKTVVLAMLDALERNHVTICADRIVRSIVRKQTGEFHVRTSYGEFDARTILLACGGKASSYFKQEKSYGYGLAEQLGHRLTPLYPALCAMKVSEDIRLLKGVRLKGTIHLYADASLEDSISPLVQGELQFSAKGISGIPAFQVSRYAAQELSLGGTVYAMVDLLPEYSSKDLRMLLSQAEFDNDTTVFTYLCGYVQPAVAEWLLKQIDFTGDSRLAMLSETQWLSIVSGMKQLRFEITGVDDFDNAQVTAGGVETADIDPATMESRCCPGCFFAGEMVNVDGTCGGYNIQFAISSAMVAAKGIMDRRDK